MQIKPGRAGARRVAGMEFLEDTAFLGSAAVILIATACIVAAVWRQEFADPGRMLIEHMLRWQGDDAMRRARESRDFPVAVAQCLRCVEPAKCRAWLSSGAREGYQTFCPNTGFIERMKKP